MDKSYSFRTNEFYPSIFSMTFAVFQAYELLDWLLGGRTMQWHQCLNFSYFGHMSFFPAVTQLYYCGHITCGLWEFLSLTSTFLCHNLLEIPYWHK
jgi:hypothetical protein